jgi:CBS domain-containing protein
MKCEEVMDRRRVTVTVDDDALRAACIMREHRIGFLPVCEESGRVVGTLADHDLVTHVCAENEEAAAVLVRDIMRKRPLLCRPDDATEQVERQMRIHHAAHAVVVDRNAHAVGIISLVDLMRREAKATSLGPGEDERRARTDRND